MKRIAACMIAALLLTACAAPASGRAADSVLVRPTAAAAEPVVPEKICEEPDVQLPAEPTDAPPAPEEGASPAPKERFPGRFSDGVVRGELCYKSKSIDVSIETCTVRQTYGKLVSYHVADVYVKDVTSIQTAAACGDFSRNTEKHVKDIADGVGALLAICGDTYSHKDNSFVIRNGVLYRDCPIENADICILYRDGRMETRAWGAFTVQEVVDADPWQVWNFGPALLDENGHAAEPQSRINASNPRAAIGYYEPGHYCFVIVDGRQDGWSDGIELSALSRLMEDLGCRAAYNLDGGGSAQLYWDGAIVSRACNEGRRISDIVYLLPEE